jgi:hypothetical protein
LAYSTAITMIASRVAGAKMSAVRSRSSPGKRLSHALKRVGMV